MAFPVYLHALFASHKKWKPAPQAKTFSSRLRNLSAMGSLTVQSVTVQFASQIVLDGVSLNISTGETVGVVGPNGAGKTTLFKAIAGMLTPDMGTVTASKGLKIGYLSQVPDVDSANTLHDEVAAAFAPLFTLEKRLHDLSDRLSQGLEGDELDIVMAQYDKINAQFVAAGGYVFEQRIDEILGGLGFSQADRNLLVSALSGGQKCRAALGRLLLQDRQLLLLDEPTNHLDIEATRWLERFLAGHHGGALIISHDRYLLNRLADRIVEVDRRGVKSYAGNYTNYANTKARLELTRARQYDKDADFIAKERAFIAKHLAGQRTKEAQGRRGRLERRLAAGEFVTEKPSANRTLSFDFQDVEVHEGTILRIEGLGKRYDSKQLFSNLDLLMDQGQRLGITGANGTGKSTLLKILLDQVEAEAGTFSFLGKTKIGYYAQDADALTGSSTMLDELRSRHPELTEQRARGLLGRFLFRGSDVFKTVNKLSGGEQSRLRMLELLLESPNVLILDEPTNHLDVAARDALEEALAAYPGTIIVVSHDRYFLDRIASRLLVLAVDGHCLHAGNYTSYVDQLESKRLAAQSPTDSSAKKSRSAKKKNTKPKPSSPPKSVPSHLDGLGVEEIETRIAEHEERLTLLGESFADPKVGRDVGAMAELQQAFDACRKELALLENAWMQRADNN